MDFSTSWQQPRSPLPRFPDRHQRQAAFQAARRHSRMVRRLKVLLPVAGGTAVLAFTIVTQFALPGDLDLSVARLSVTPNSIIMDDPHLTGFDEDGREYSVAADRAVQAIRNPDAVRLEDIRATVKTEAQGTATIQAESGDYDNKESTLQLHGGIAVNSSEGYALRMTDADIDLQAGTMKSANPATVSYHDSTTSGKSISVTGGGKRIRLDGDVRTTLMPPKRAPQPAGQPVQE